MLSCAECLMFQSGYRIGIFVIVKSGSINSTAKDNVIISTGSAQVAWLQTATDIHQHTQIRVVGVKASLPANKQKNQ